MRNSAACALLATLNLCVLTGLSTGCTASGVPRFAKFTRDGRWLLFEDQSYPKVYVRDLDSQKQYVYHGNVACIGPDADQLVLAPRPACFPIGHFQKRVDLLLLELGGDPPKEVRLPPLITELDDAALHLYFAGRRTIRAAYHPIGGPETSAPSMCYEISDYRSQWQPVAKEKSFGGDSPCVWQRLPDGVERGGFAIAPHGEPLTWGADAEEEWHGDRVVRLVRSPDKRFVIRVYDIEDPWQRMTLVDAKTGRREIILDENDAGWDLFLLIICIPTLPLEWMIMNSIG